MAPEGHQAPPQAPLGHGVAFQEHIDLPELVTLEKSEEPS